MYKWIISLLLVLQPTLVAQEPKTASNEPKAVIVGPESAITGDLVVLKGTGSVGKGAKWIIPEVTTLQCGTCDFVPDLAFATGRPGTYKFILVVSMNDEINYTEHSVTITTLQSPEPPPVINPPPGPSPEKGLAELSRQLSISRNDPTTRAALAITIENQVKVFRQMCSEGRCPTIDSAKSMMTKTINQTFLARQGESKKVDWQVWREPLYDKINKQTYSALDQYLSDLEEISKGLK